jgi:hypothetical protein
MKDLHPFVDHLVEWCFRFLTMLKNWLLWNKCSLQSLIRFKVQLQQKQCSNCRIVQQLVLLG